MPSGSSGIARISAPSSRRAEQRAVVGRRLDHHDVAGLDQRLEQERVRLHRAVGGEDAIRLDAVLRGDPLEQVRIAGRGAVRERARRITLEGALRSGPQVVDGDDVERRGAARSEMFVSSATSRHDTGAATVRVHLDEDQPAAPRRLSPSRRSRSWPCCRVGTKILPHRASHDRSGPVGARGLGTGSFAYSPEKEKLLEAAYPRFNSERGPGERQAGVRGGRGRVERRGRVADRLRAPSSSAPGRPPPRSGGGCSTLRPTAVVADDNPSIVRTPW